MLHLGKPCTGKDIDSNEHFPNSDLTPYSALKWALFGIKGAIQNFKTGKVLSPLSLGKTNYPHFCPKKAKILYRRRTGTDPLFYINCVFNDMGVGPSAKHLKCFSFNYNFSGKGFIKFVIGQCTELP